MKWMKDCARLTKQHRKETCITFLLVLPTICLILTYCYFTGSTNKILQQQTSLMNQYGSLSYEDMDAAFEIVQATGSNRDVSPTFQHAQALASHPDVKEVMTSVRYRMVDPYNFLKTEAQLQATTYDLNDHIRAQKLFELSVISHFNDTSNDTVSFLNLPTLMQGEVPIDASSCLVSTSFATRNNLMIGDTITLNFPRKKDTAYGKPLILTIRGIVADDPNDQDNEIYTTGDPFSEEGYQNHKEDYEGMLVSFQLQEHVDPTSFVQSIQKMSEFEHFKPVLEGEDFKYHARVGHIEHFASQLHQFMIPLILLFLSLSLMIMKIRMKKQRYEIAFMRQHHIPMRRYFMLHCVELCCMILPITLICFLVLTPLIQPLGEQAWKHEVITTNRITLEDNTQIVLYEQPHVIEHLSFAWTFSSIQIAILYCFCFFVCLSLPCAYEIMMKKRGDRHVSRLTE